MKVSSSHCPLLFPRPHPPPFSENDSPKYVTLQNIKYNAAVSRFSILICPLRYTQELNFNSRIFGVIPPICTCQFETYSRRIFHRKKARADTSQAMNESNSLMSLANLQTQSNNSIIFGKPWHSLTFHFYARAARRVASFPSSLSCSSMCML